MTDQPTTEDRAKALFAQQLRDLATTGAAADSQTRLAAIFDSSEAACREQDTRLALDTVQRRSDQRQR